MDKFTFPRLDSRDAEYSRALQLQQQLIEQKTRSTLLANEAAHYHSSADYWEKRSVELERQLADRTHEQEARIEELTRRVERLSEPVGKMTTGLHVVPESKEEYMSRLHSQDDNPHATLADLRRSLALLQGIGPRSFADNSYAKFCLWMNQTMERADSLSRFWAGNHLSNYPYVGAGEEARAQVAAMAAQNQQVGDHATSQLKMRLGLSPKSPPAEGSLVKVEVEGFVAELFLGSKTLHALTEKGSLVNEYGWRERAVAAFAAAVLLLQGQVNRLNKEIERTAYDDRVRHQHEAAVNLIDAIATPMGRDFEQAWKRATLIFGRHGQKATLVAAIVPDLSHLERGTMAGEVMSAPMEKTATDGQNGFGPRE